MIGPVHIAVVCDYREANASHRATNSAYAHVASALDLEVDVTWVATNSLDANPAGDLVQFDALMAAPGSPYTSFNGALGAIRFARERGLPFTGT